MDVRIGAYDQSVKDCVRENDGIYEGQRKLNLYVLLQTPCLCIFEKKGWENEDE